MLVPVGPGERLVRDIWAVGYKLDDALTAVNWSFGRRSSHVWAGSREGQGREHTGFFRVVFLVSKRDVIGGAVWENLGLDRALRGRGSHFEPSGRTGESETRGGNLVSRRSLSWRNWCGGCGVDI